MKEPIDINAILNELNIISGDKILVSSNIMNLLILLKKYNEKFDPNKIIDALIKKVSPDGTLMFPTFNWDFCEGKGFDYNSTPSKTGSLSSLALKRKDFQRTKNPIYSFAVTGKDKDLICNLNHHSCFGLDSPFGYLIKNHGKNLFIGLNYKYGGFAFHHVAEETVGVDYRYFKDFTGFYTDRFKKKTKTSFRLYVRDLSLNFETRMDKKMDEVLFEKNAYIRKIVKGINFELIDIPKAYEILVNDLKSKGGLVYPKYM